MTSTNKQANKLTQAIILAGGLGTRLKSVVADKPKVLSPVAGKPFLHYIIQYLQKQEITEYVFSLGYLADQVLDFLKVNYPNLNYTYCIEDTPLGTGGGIKKAMQLTTNDNVLIVNADTYFDVSLQSMFSFHEKSLSNCTISLKKMTNFDRYGTVELNEENTILTFKEKAYQSEGLINGGYVIISKSIFLAFTQQLPEIFSFEKDFLETNIQKLAIKGFVSEGYFIDIGIPEDFQKAQIVFSNHSLVN